MMAIFGQGRCGRERQTIIVEGKLKTANFSRKYISRGQILTTSMLETEQTNRLNQFSVRVTSATDVKFGAKLGSNVNFDTLTTCVEVNENFEKVCRSSPVPNSISLVGDKSV